MRNNQITKEASIDGAPETAPKEQELALINQYARKPLSRCTEGSEGDTPYCWLDGVAPYGFGLSHTPHHDLLVLNTNSSVGRN